MRIAPEWRSRSMPVHRCVAQGTGVSHRIVYYISVNHVSRINTLIRCMHAENICTSQLNGCHSSFPQRALEHFGVVDFLGALPVMTSQSVLKCRSNRASGSSPGGTAISVEHIGPILRRTAVSNSIHPLHVEPSRRTRTFKRAPIHGVRIPLLARVRLRRTVVSTESLRTMITLERQVVHNATVYIRGRALLANV